MKISTCFVPPTGALCTIIEPSGVGVDDVLSDRHAPDRSSTAAADCTFTCAAGLLRTPLSADAAATNSTRTIGP